MAAEGSGAHARVQVNFEDSGSKWLVLSYANLQAVCGKTAARSAGLSMTRRPWSRAGVVSSAATAAVRTEIAKQAIQAWIDGAVGLVRRAHSAVKFTSVH